MAAFEMALKVALIGKAELQRYIDDRLLLFEQLLAAVDALVQLKGMRRLSIGLLEVEDQVIGA